MVKAGGFTKGGFNFDAKVRRQSVDALDLVYVHVAGINTLAHGLLIAAKMVEDDKLGSFKETRYADWSEGFGKRILAKELDLATKNAFGPKPRSGRQEMLENMVRHYP